MKEFLEKCGWYKYLNDIKKDWFIGYKDTIEKGKPMKYKLSNGEEVFLSLGLKSIDTLLNRNKAVIHKNIENLFIIISDNNFLINKKLSEDIITNEKHIPEDILENFKELTLVRIKECSESVRLFGYSLLKKRMRGKSTEELDINGHKIINYNNHNIVNIIPQFICKDSIKRDVIVLRNNETGKDLKFVASELEFLFPDIHNIEIINLLKGYNAPLDRTINTGKNVKILKNKNKIPYGTKSVIGKITKVGNNIYCSVNVNNRAYMINKNKLKVIQ